MNAFAEGVFNALLSWLRLGSQRLFRYFSSGSEDGFLTWLGDHWLGAVAALCVLGLVIDYVVWYFRWRPDLAWRTRMRHFMARMRGEEMRRKDTQQFAHGYQDSSFFQEYVGSAPEQPAEYDNEETDGMTASGSYGPAYTFDQSAPQRPYVRQYRSSGKKKANLIRQWVEGSDNDQPVDRIPLNVDQRQAFHDPVYPEKIDPDDY